MLFSGGKFTELSVRSADRRSDFFFQNRLPETVTTTTQKCKEQRHGELTFFALNHVTGFQLRELPGSAAGADAVFFPGQKCDEGSDNRHFSMYGCSKLPKTLPVTTLPLFGHVTLFCRFKCGSFLFYLMSEGSV